MFKRKKAPMEIEEVINKKLKGDAQQNALGFVAFLRGNEVRLEVNNISKDGCGCAIGDVGCMAISKKPAHIAPWTIWFNSCDFDESAPIDEALKETAWANAGICGHCHAGWKDCGGGEQTIFGRKFERLCHSPMMFVNPDAQTVEHAKKLLLMLK